MTTPPLETVVADTAERIDSYERTVEAQPAEEHFKDLERQGLGRLRHGLTDPVTQEFVEGARRENGGYEWSFQYQPNVDGKLTKAADAVLDLMMPSVRIETEAADNRKPKGMERLRDAKGQVQFIEPGQAERTARANGWHSVPALTRGASVRVGLKGGQLFRRDGRGGWEPTGRETCGPFGRPADHSIVHVGPDGTYWSFIAEDWRNLSGQDNQEG